MKKVTIQVDAAVYELFQKVGKAAGGLTAEQVMADVLFRCAGEMAVTAIKDQKRTIS